MQQVRLLALTIAMTGMIWIAADQRVTRLVELDLAFAIRPAPGTTLALEVDGPPVDSLRITFKGPNRVLSQLKMIQETLSIDLPISERSSGPQTLNLLDELLAQADQLAGIPEGVAIVATTPGTMTIVVDHYVEKQVRLKVDSGNYDFDGDPQFDPSVVMAWVPERQFEALPPDKQTITIPIGRLIPGQAQEGQLIQKEVLVPHMLDGGVSVLRLDPERVTFSATLLQHTKRVRLPTIPVNLTLSNIDIWDHYQLRFAEDPDKRILTIAIWIRGPEDVVDEMVQDSSMYDIFGYVRITSEDLPDSETAVQLSKQVSIENLPDGVVLDEDPDPVDIELIPRS
ncbi:MAG: hypothetical protein IH895_08520 [Planctomycetes bacterium]|nr:hypothetical protein [Planctomycetota bacterium]